MYAALASDPDLPKPETLETYVLPEETVILDRKGTRELARFGDARREIVTFEEIPPLVLDATTAIEDKTFWENAGFDPVARASSRTLVPPWPAVGRVSVVVLSGIVIVSVAVAGSPSASVIV